MADRGPNVLLIHTDQHRFDCLRCCGNPDIQTPNIDGLAAKGVTYTNSFCPYPVCTPSRYSLLTGLYVRQHLGWGNHSTLPAGLPTFPRALREAGYKTEAVGKMHFTPTYLDVGFSKMILSEQAGPGRWDDDYHRWLRKEGLCDRLDLYDQVPEYRTKAPDIYWRTLGALPSDLDEAHHSTTWIGDQAVNTLRSWGEGGNLLMVGFIKPHHPFDPPAPWDQMYSPDDLSLLPGWTEQRLDCDAFYAGYFENQDLSQRLLQRIMALYYASISQIDFQVGRMLSALEEQGLYDNTMIVFTSDHGEYLGFHRLLLKGNHMYDPLVRVPLIIKYPGAEGATPSCSALVNNIDVAPTILDCADVPIPETMKGRRLGSDTLDARFAICEAFDATMIRSASSKLQISADPDKCLFFDLETDPLEMENRYNDPACRKEIEEMRDALNKWALLDARSPLHLDEYARCADASNVQTLADGHREDIMAYFEEQIADPGLPWKEAPR